MASIQGTFDYIVVTVAIFPDWDQPLLQENGFDKAFAVAVVGRYRLYRGAKAFLNFPKDLQMPPPVVLNVMASGELPLTSFDRELASGKRTVNTLFESLGLISVANDLMQIGLEEYAEHFGSTRVSTHPGLLMTDLHRGQGVLFDALEALGVFLMGFSEEEAGLRQASIMVSSALQQGGLSYVDSQMYGRLRSPQLQREVDQHLAWLWALLKDRT